MNNLFPSSRTVHCGQLALTTEDLPLDLQKEQRIHRNVVYVCMKPRKYATEANLRKKRKAFDQLRMTTHWPHKPKLFPVNPRTYGGPLPNVVPIPKPELTELGKKIAGF